jgi:hypothetical protein
LSYRSGSARRSRTRNNLNHELTVSQVFQERLLTPRVLHFTQGQLFWECREHRACESFPEGHSLLSGAYEDSATAEFKSLVLDSYSPHAVKHDGNEQTKYYDIWWGLVKVYTKTRLTNPLDKLVALSGVAKQMSLLLQDTYVAGMWRSTLESDIRWYTVYAEPRPTVYRAPSWSWASVDGAVMPGNFAEMLAHIVDVDIRHATEDSTGLITSGWLDLRGQLKRVVLSDAEKLGQNDSWHEIIIPLSSGLQITASVLPDVEPFKDQVIVDDSGNGRLFCMPIAKGHKGDPWMLLLRVVDAQKGVFQRFGLASLYDLPNGAGYSHQLLEDMGEESEAELPCLEYRNGLHTIRII